MGRSLANDPTRTGLLVRAFLANFRRRVVKLQQAVRQVVVTEDAFGLTLPTRGGITGNADQRWRFLTNPKKAEAFLEWFQEQLDLGLLEIEPGGGGNWSDTYVSSAYKKGVLRAYADTHPEAGASDAAFYAGGRNAFLVSAFGAPESIQRLALLHMRTFEQLRGITAAMAQQISAILTAGIANGTHPNKLARQLNKSIEGISRSRGLKITRTELIHAHAEGQLDAFEDLGIEELGLYAEISTAGDGRVCPLCDAASRRVYTIAQARGILPLHPLCRCCWVPSYKVRVPAGTEPTANGDRPITNRGWNGRVSRFAGRAHGCSQGTHSRIKTYRQHAKNRTAVL